jgi:hypothetical protein
MLYAALTFWLLVIMFAAWGVHHIWSGLIKPRTVNFTLLPGTLAAQLGHVMGLLVTGNSVKNTQLMGDDEKGDPKSATPDRVRLPVAGPIIIGLLPLVACAVCLWFAARYWGWSVIQGLNAEEVRGGLARTLPTSVPAFWDFLRGAITLMERMLDGVLRSDLPNWSTILFLYLAICLTVRMAPFEGNRRGAIGAVLLSGLVIGLLGSLIPAVRETLAASGPSWLILSFAVAALLFLLLISLLAAGVVGIVRILAGKQ